MGVAATKGSESCPLRQSCLVFVLRIMRRRQRSFFALLVLCLTLEVMLLPGCPTPVAPVTPVNHQGQARVMQSAGELLERVTRANDGYGTLKTIHQVTIEIVLGPNRSEKRSFRAVLAVRRPGYFRLHLLGPLSQKLVDLLYDSGRYRTIFLAEELTQSSQIPEIIDSISGDIAAIYRLDPQPQISRRTMEETLALASGRAPLYQLQEYQGDEVLRRWSIFASTLAVAQAELVDKRGDMRTITYGDYEKHGQVLLPRSIHLAKEGTTFYWLSIRVESVTIDEELDDKLFIAPQGP